MPPTMKLTYFTGKGVGEVICSILRYGELEFEYERIERADWPNIKPSTPFGQLPLLEENGKVAWQSLAICRYIAKKVKLTGQNDWEDLEIDAAVDTINDLKWKIVDIVYEEDPEVKKKRREAAIQETIPYYYGKFEEMAEKCKGHLAADKLTWADIFFTKTNDTITKILEEDLLKNFPNLAELSNSVLAILAAKT